jgi:HEAT repeat protein
MKKHVSEWWQRAGEMAQRAAEEPEGYKSLVEAMGKGDFLPGWALICAGTPAIPALIAGLKHPHARVRRECVDTIDHGGYGGDARCVEALLPLLQDPIPHIRRAVWHTLFCERCPRPERCDIPVSETLDHVALLIEIGLQDPNPKLRCQCVVDLSHRLPDDRARVALEKWAHELLTC